MAEQLKAKEDKSSPLLQALVLVERGYRDHESGVFVLSGVFSTLFVADLPARMPFGVKLFISLGRIRKGMKFDLVINSPEGELIAKNVVTIEESPSSGMKDFLVPIPEAQILRTFGLYSIELRFEDARIGSRGFKVSPLQSEAVIEKE